MNVNYRIVEKSKICSRIELNSSFDFSYVSKKLSTIFATALHAADNSGSFDFSAVVNSKLAWEAEFEKSAQEKRERLQEELKRLEKEASEKKAENEKTEKEYKEEIENLIDLFFMFFDSFFSFTQVFFDNITFFIKFFSLHFHHIIPAIFILQMSAFNIIVAKMVDNFFDTYEKSKEEFNSIQEAIEIKKKHLQELYNIESTLFDFFLSFHVF